jgi:transposase-like protein
MKVNTLKEVAEHFGVSVSIMRHWKRCRALQRSPYDLEAIAIWHKKYERNHRTLTDVAREIGISQSTIYAWRKQGCPGLQQKPYSISETKKWRKERTDERRALTRQELTRQIGLDKTIALVYFKRPQGGRYTAEEFARLLAICTTDDGFATQAVKARLRRSNGFFTKGEAAHTLGIAAHSLIWMIKNKLVPAPNHKIGGRKYFNTTAIETLKDVIKGRDPSEHLKNIGVLTSKQVAERLGLYPQTLWEWVKRGILPAASFKWRKRFVYLPSEVIKLEKCLIELKATDLNIRSAFRYLAGWRNAPQLANEIGIDAKRLAHAEAKGEIPKRRAVSGYARSLHWSAYEVEIIKAYFNPPIRQICFPIAKRETPLLKFCFA